MPYPRGLQTPVERHDPGARPADAVDHALRAPVVVAAVGPPLVGVHVVADGLDGLAERVLAAPGQPDHHTRPATEQEPAAEQNGVEDPEPSALPDVDVLVIVDEAAPAWSFHVAGAVDDVADRGGEPLPEHEPLAVDVTVLALAEVGEVARPLPRGQPVAVGDETCGSHRERPGRVERERDRAVRARPVVGATPPADRTVEAADHATGDGQLGLQVDEVADETAEHAAEEGAERGDCRGLDGACRHRISAAGAARGDGASRDRATRGWSPGRGRRPTRNPWASPSWPPSR